MSRPGSRSLALLAAPAVLVALFTGAGCRALEPAPLPPPPTLALAAAWRTLEPFAFEDYAAALVPEDTRFAFDADSREELEAALAEEVPTCVRAAVLLGRSWAPESTELLLERLEQRAEHEARNADAGDVVAAAALGNARRYADELEAERAAGRLAALGAGGKPHPDLEVRVECAASALALGNDSVVPFLLQVLRLGTWAGMEDELDFEPAPTTAWVRGRAAQALSAAAGVPVTYGTEGSVVDREEEAAKLAARFGTD